MVVGEGAGRQAEGGAARRERTSTKKKITCRGTVDGSGRPPSAAAVSSVDAASSAVRITVVCISLRGNLGVIGVRIETRRTARGGRRVRSQTVHRLKAATQDPTDG
eukprot:SAG31_NODE_580_length_13940_cov_16.175349_6_plen_106_part_00